MKVAEKRFKMKVEFNLRELKKIYDLLLEIGELDGIQKDIFDKLGSILYPLITTR